MKLARKSKECNLLVKSQETPLCIGCMVYANVLKKEIVERLHVLGMHTVSE